MPTWVFGYFESLPERYRSTQISKGLSANNAVLSGTATAVGGGSAGGNAIPPPAPKRMRRLVNNEKLPLILYKNA